MGKAPVIEVRDLKKIYRQGFFLKPVEVLKGISFTVYENEIYGFLGPNGAGKTTTIKILNTIVFPDGGEAKIFGRPLGDPESKKKTGFLPEHPYFYEYLTASEFLRFCGNLFGMKGEALEERIGSLLSLVGLEGKEDLQLRKFSKGMLQRIGIAQALINDPSLVILDEPMSGLDPIGRMEIRELIRSLKEKGKTVFFSSHIISDVELLAERVCILHMGEKVAEGKIHDLIGSRGVKYYEVDAKGVAGNVERLRELIGRRDFSFIMRNGIVQVRVPEEEDVDLVIDAVRELGGRVVGVIPARVNLEEIFVQRLGGEENAG
ncbi:MAG: ABC transporter ATP-binding protein [Deltaproteobacteria bacterium]|nr:MAG: ABC transporter ATP-binding protein [Deltaproteobacteria bacterium]